MASKSSTGLTLSKAAGIQNVFVNDWKKAFFSDAKKRIASIPFMRNLVEFTRGNEDPQFLRLTSLLHWKNDTDGIKESELAAIYNHIFGGSNTLKDGDKLVVDLVNEHAQECLGADAGVNFEHKIVLSIAIRLQAERFMVAQINDTAFVASIKANQTPVLLAKFKKPAGANGATIQTLERVLLMTPENIHLNSFMYEPILDMSDKHLRKLYQEVLELK